MNNIFIIFSFGILTGGVVVWFFIGHKIKNYLGGFIQINKRKKVIKEEHKQKIMEMFSSHKFLTNEMVAGELGVSRATAIRYFDNLEKEGKVKQEGRTGWKTYYTKIQ